jgi:hypothetical protein
VTAYWLFAIFWALLAVGYQLSRIASALEQRE